MLQEAGIEHYQSAQIQSASRGKLVVLMYGAIISSLAQAKKLIEEKPRCTNGDATWIERSHAHLSKALHVLTELIKALNFKEGGDIAKNLHSLYIYVYELIVDADLMKQKEPIDAALNFLIPLRDAFDEADKDFRKEKRRMMTG